LLSGADDCQCGIGIKNDQGMTALPGDLSGEVRQVIVGGSSACLFG
jgi:hypothetical protein